jgi:predicted lipoprotein with Yx(FWY)xxD motif
MKSALTALLAGVAIAGGCGDDSAEPANDDEPPAEMTQEAAADSQSTRKAESAARPGPRVKLRGSQLGPVLFDGRDRALYLFTRDARNKSRCYGECAVAWPPFLAKGRPRAVRGVKQSLLGTTRRRGGARQVTYKGQPLYFYVDDPRGQVLCNDVPEFGGTWFAVDARGNPPT